MPKASVPPIDRSKAAMLRASGMTYLQISEVLGVSHTRIRSFFKRTGLTKEMNEVKNLSAQIVSKEPDSVSMLTKTAQIVDNPVEIYKKSASVVINRIAGHLSTTDVNDPRGMAGQSMTLKSINDVAKTIYGLDKETGPTFVFNMDTLRDPAEKVVE